MSDKITSPTGASYTFSQEVIDELNATLSNIKRETETLFQTGNEQEIMFAIEKQRKIYLFMKVEGEKAAKARNLKRLKEYGDARVKPQPSLVSKSASAKRGKKPQTKDEKLSSSLESLGLDPSAFLKRLKS